MMNKKPKNKKMEARLIESEVRYRRLFETAHDGILILNSETGQITDVNPFLIKLLGFSKSEFLSKKLWEVGAFKNIKASRDAFEILQNQGFLRYENLPLETKNGRLVEVEFVANSYMAGDTLVIQCNIRDMTERRKLELVKDTERIIKEERSRLASIADATHELRTPLAIIKGNVDLALQSKAKNRKPPTKALHAIDNEIKNLSEILSDLTLVTSKAWELKNRIVYEKVNVKSLITEVVERCKALAYKKNISITTKSIPSLYIIGDKIYLEKMLVNLVKNSIIYGKKNGKTLIKIKKSKEFISISVADNGIGMSDEDALHVFERFYRADKSHGSNEHSAGLGLAIVKWVAELHGGEVHVKNGKNIGSVFTVSLPIKAINTAPEMNS